MTLAETILASGVSVAVVSLIREIIMHFIQRKSKRNDAADTMRVAMRAILRDRIRYLCKCHVKAGHISFEDRGDLLEMHDVYHNTLGGNGNLDSAINAIMKLPLE